MQRTHTTVASFYAQNCPGLLFLVSFVIVVVFVTIGVVPRDLAIEEGEAAKKSAKELEGRLRQRLQEVAKREVRRRRGS